MKQPVKKNVNKVTSTKNPTKKYYKKKKVFKKSNEASEQDGSGLETYFRTNFLDKLNIEYVQQFEAKDIGRFYDFMIPGKNILIECDGSYFHCDPRIYDKPISSTQKHNVKVDEIKNKWALLHGFCLIRVWEEDIKKNPQKVIEDITKHIGSQSEKILLDESKKNGTFYMKKK